MVMVELWYLDSSQGGTWAPAGCVTVPFALGLLCSPIDTLCLCISTPTLMGNVPGSEGVKLGNCTGLEVSFGG